MRLISLFLVGVGTIILAGCDSGGGNAVKSTTAAPARGPAGAAAATVTPPPASCELLDPRQFATMAYTSQGDPRKYLRGNAFRAVSDAYKFVTPVANDVTRLQRYSGGKCGAKKVVPDCSTLEISSDLKMTLTDITGTSPQPVFTGLQLTANNPSGKPVDYLKSDPWTNAAGTFTFFVYFLDHPATTANGPSTTELYKDYELEVFEQGGSCDNERPDVPGNITNVPPPTPSDPPEKLQQTDTTQGHEGHN